MRMMTLSMQGIHSVIRWLEDSDLSYCVTQLVDEGCMPTKACHHARKRILQLKKNFASVMNVKQLGKRNIVRKERWFLMRCNTFHWPMLIQRVVRRGLNHLRKRQNGKNDFDARVTSGVCRTTGVIVPPLQRGLIDKYAYFQTFIFLSPTYVNDNNVCFHFSCASQRSTTVPSHGTRNSDLSDDDEPTSGEEE